MVSRLTEVASVSFLGHWGAGVTRGWVFMAPILQKGSAPKREVGLRPAFQHRSPIPGVVLTRHDPLDSWCKHPGSPLEVLKWRPIGQPH